MSSNEDRARALADRVRRDYELDDAPINDLFELVYRACGIDVMSMDAGQDEHGLTMCHPTTGFLIIAVATTPHPMRQRSSIAHELGHVLAGDLDAGVTLTPGSRTPEEIRADAFARHLLIPLDGVRRRVAKLDGPLTQAHLSDLVQRFEVSPAMAAIQLRTLGKISQDTCTEWSSDSASRLAARFGWADQYRALAVTSQAPRAPQGLMSRAVEGYRRGVLSVAELAHWYGQSPADLESELGPPVPVDDADAWNDDDDEWDPSAPLFPDTNSEGGP
ncbi:ImmA/IrrE family metallo-endopeptidase [Cellulomonas timonensis]|uniref:ImmA/IrrE family metallo-endopeptidase n=1 Tax=Cellulomonas timonensis TaxID=1689271 RepID=UPI000831B29C|nr:ImmA/IrrE family metallo-endopeptidase [Cellulomonas timonensis]